MWGNSEESGGDDGHYHSGNEFGVFGKSGAIKPMWVRRIRGKVDDFVLPKASKYLYN